MYWRKIRRVTDIVPDAYVEFLVLTHDLGIIIFSTTFILLIFVIRKMPYPFTLRRRPENSRARAITSAQLPTTTNVMSHNTKTTVASIAVEGNAPSSPETRRLNGIAAKSAVRTWQEDAFEKLLQSRASNGGEPQYGDIQKILNDYHRRGFTSVTRGNLDHRLKLYKQDKRMKLVGNNKPDVPVQRIVVDVDNVTPNSGVTDPDTEESSDPMVSKEGDLTEEEVEVVCERSSVGGRKKGSTIKAHYENFHCKEDALTLVTKLYWDAKTECKRQGHKKTYDGCLDDIIKQVESSHNLHTGAIN
jgi:hypothetical protein